ncbi:hypothetical protein MVEN_00811600 [Mycena venus]|uniref:Uncharacterized protein n=1 Tax=Mycena venus TaxID=2733690 RepID=A0A8H6YLA6_9AGAR|nr:hypothetical protein MVEN_00811600 [Mycena venus]
MMGFSPYVILAETKAKISEHRALCAVTTPPVTHAAHCEDHTACSNSFAHAWWGEAGKTGIAIVLVHPALIPAKRILTTIPDLNTSWQMAPSCRKRTAMALKDDALKVLLREEVFIANAIKELKKF